MDRAAQDRLIEMQCELRPVRASVARWANRYAARPEPRRQTGRFWCGDPQQGDVGGARQTLDPDPRLLAEGAEQRFGSGDRLAEAICETVEKVQCHRRVRPDMRQAAAEP